MNTRLQSGLRVIAIIGACVTSLGIAACGSSSSSSSQSSSSTSTQAAQTSSTVQTSATPTGPPIKVMIAGTLSGPTNLPELPHGAQAAAADINAHGGIDGRPIDVIVCNDSNPSPDACARKAVADHVAAVVGSQSLGINPILKANRIPQVGPYPFVPDDYTQPNEFPVSGGSVAAGATVPFLTGQGVHKIQPLVLAGAFATSSAVTFMKETAARTPGVTILPPISLPFPSTDLSAQTQKAGSSGAQAIVVIAFPTQNVQVLSAARTAGLTQKLVFSGATFPQALVDHVKAAANGVYTLSSFLPVSANVPAIQQFKQDMAKYAPGQELSDISLNSWAAVQMFAIAAKHATTINAAGIMKVMPTLKNVNLGVTGPFSYGQPGPMPGAPRVVNVNTYFGLVKNQVITPVSTTPTPAYP
jgi:branched-chain amino acid transport system substrate-binding protein